MACPKCHGREVYCYDADEDFISDDRLQRCAACGHIFDMDDHADEPEDWESIDPPAPPPPSKPGHHQFDDDAVCTRCGFDGAEWWHWKHNTHEGRASDAQQPMCEGALA